MDDIINLTAINELNVYDWLFKINDNSLSENINLSNYEDFINSLHANQHLSKKTGVVLDNTNTKLNLILFLNAHNTVSLSDPILADQLRLTNNDLFSMLLQSLGSPESLECFLSSFMDVWGFIYSKFVYVKKCPYFWQFTYGYFLLLFLYVKYNRSHNDSYWHKSSINEFILLIKSINLKTLQNSFTVVTGTIKVFLLNPAKLQTALLLVQTLARAKSNLWTPIFKKLSYLGIFSFIRSKWFKKK